MVQMADGEKLLTEFPSIRHKKQDGVLKNGHWTTRYITCCLWHSGVSSSLVYQSRGELQGVATVGATQCLLLQLSLHCMVVRR